MGFFMHVGRYPYYLLPDIASHEITDTLIDGGYYILMPLAQGIAEIEGTSATVTNLLSTSSSAYTKTDGMNAATTEKEDGDAEGTFHIGAASELGDGKLVWFTSAGMLDSYIDLTVTSAQNSFWSIVMIGLIPLGFIALGVVVTIRRKRR